MHINIGFQIEFMTYKIDISRIQHNPVQGQHTRNRQKSENIRLQLNNLTHDPCKLSESFGYSARTLFVSSSWPTESSSNFCKSQVPWGYNCHNNRHILTLSTDCGLG